MSDVEKKDSDSTREVVSFLSNSAAWPIEASRSQRIEDLAEELKEIIYEREEIPELIADFKQHGYEWREVDWEEVAACMLSDAFGNSWELKYQFDTRYKHPIQGKSFKDLADQLRAMADEIEKLDERDEEPPLIFDKYEINFMDD